MTAVVVSIGGSSGVKRPPGTERRLRRLAMQIVVQLPEDAQEALDVLEHAKALVRALADESRPA